MTERAESDSEALNAFEPLKSGTDPVRRVIERVLKLEQERLYQRQPHLNDDVLRILKEEIR